MVAEQFGTLASLFPGRVDLGLGRAPGTDQLTAQALRRHLSGGADTFPRDVVELLHYFQPATAGQAVRAVPGAGLDVDVWILGSSTFGAQLAAMLGLPYAFASHFAPAELDRALAIYRERFEPSERLAKPYVMAAATVIAADTDAEARRLFSSLQQSFVALRTGMPGPLPPPVDDMDSRLDPQAKSMLSQALACAVIGGPATIAAGLGAFQARTGADEIIATASIFDHAARVRSFEITARAFEAADLAA
jgi:luciferase family oxidoreductase group 1